MNGMQLRAAMAAGQPIWGTMIVSLGGGRAGAARSLRGAPFDYAIVDSEHSPNARSELADMGAALLAAGVCPIVRVPHTEPHETVMALDAGFHGVLVPYCETVAQVSAVVSVARLRPLKGGLQTRVREAGEFPSEATREYLEKRNANTVVIIGKSVQPAGSRDPGGEPARAGATRHRPERSERFAWHSRPVRPSALRRTVARHGYRDGADVRALAKLAAPTTRETLWRRCAGDVA